MTTQFANDLELLFMLVFFASFVAWAALATKVRLAVIRGDKARSGYELGKNYKDPERFRMHEVLFGKSWMRRFSRISFGFMLMALVPYGVLSMNDLFHNHLLHLISRGR